MTFLYPEGVHAAGWWMILPTLLTKLMMRAFGWAAVGSHEWPAHIGDGPFWPFRSVFSKWLPSNLFCLSRRHSDNFWPLQSVHPSPLCPHFPLPQFLSPNSFFHSSCLRKFLFLISAREKKRGIIQVLISWDYFELVAAIFESINYKTIENCFYVFLLYT